jgi:hypothetical protein
MVRLTSLAESARCWPAHCSALFMTAESRGASALIRATNASPAHVIEAPAIILFEDIASRFREANPGL